MKLRVLGLSVDSHAATSHAARAAQMGITQTAAICGSSEHFSHYHRPCQGLHSHWIFLRCIIIKIAVSLSCPDTSARPDTSGSNEPRMFGRYSALVVQEHRIWSFPALHLHTKLDRKAHFPFSKVGFPAGAECSAFLSLANI